MRRSRSELLRSVVAATLLGSAALVAGGCGGAIGRVTLPKGLLFESTTVPLFIGASDGPRRGEPVAIPEGLVRFEVSAQGVDPNPPVVGLPGDYSIAWGDVSWRRIMTESGLKRIVYADGKYFSVLNGMYERATIVVYGVPEGADDPEGDRREGPGGERSGDGPPPWARGGARP